MEKALSTFTTASTVSAAPKQQDAAQVEHESGLWQMPWYIYAALLATTSIVVGSAWDIMWHLSIGRDTLFSPPHLVIYLGGLLGGLGGAYQLFRMSFFVPAYERQRGVAFWGFRAPLAALFSIWGALAMLTSAPFDDWWHNAYGLDVKILSPPHALLGIGMLFIQVGAMIQLRTYQREQAHKHHMRLPISLMLAFTLGMLIVTLDGMFSAQFLRPNLAHSALFYQVSALIFPFLLLTANRATGLRFGATAAAASYTLLLLLMYWIVPLFPAEPLLGPVLQQNDHFFPYRFPLMLLLPALSVDLLSYFTRKGPATRSAWMGGLVFLAVFLPLQWYYSAFQLQPDTLHALFGGPVRGYFINPDPAFLYRFVTKAGETPLSLVAGMGLAALFAAASAWLGHRWAAWLLQLKR